MAAARAGATHVSAIEAGPIAQVTRELFRANGVLDRITLMQTHVPARGGRPGLPGTDWISVRSPE
jgi:hypothetical protein